VGLQVVILDIGDNEPAGEYTIFYGKGNETMKYEQDSQA
jgi:hypothetical protein